MLYISSWTRIQTRGATQLRRWTRPDSYMGAEWHEYFSAGVGCSRDSRPLERANFDEMLELLGGESDTVIVVHEGHWAVGWVEWIAIHESDAVSIEKAVKANERMENYPVLNEERYSDYEYEEAIESWQSMSVSERVQLLQEHGECIFSARHNDYFPDETGSVQESLLGY